MKQAVNLYLPEFRKKREWLDALRMVQATGALLLLLAAWVGLESWQLSRDEQVWTEAEAHRVAAENLTAQLRASFGTQAADENLVVQNEQLQSDLKEKRAILTFMEGKDLGQTTGFSDFMADLARYHVQGLSLKSINLSQNGKSVTLDGEVMQAELVPMYLQSLNRGTSFRGLSFHDLVISELALPAESAQQPAFSFKVSTTQ
jgi:hypothetical protein